MTPHRTRPADRSSGARPPVICLVSLGCSKNTVDSECLLGNLARAGLLIAEDPADADVCLVNTCGFIDAAREETAAVLSELSGLKARGSLRAVAALGCLVERVTDCPGMAGVLKAADAQIGFAQYPRLPEICRRLAEGTKAGGRSHPTTPESFTAFLNSPRVRIGSPHTAYLKISEGCSNQCLFCSIPSIRGRQVSRPMEDILAEARALAAAGAREINLIAQDTTSYGLDLYGTSRLRDLLRQLGAVDPGIWFRLMYAHPRHLSEEILDTLASETHLCPYIDLPLQHIADPMLKAMGRGMNRDETIALLDDVRRKLPEGALRTTFVVGYPGETAEHFAELLDFVREGRFTHAGVFLYSCEPRTPAARLKDDVPAAEKARRRDALMLAQLEVSRARLRKQVGRTVEVMLDGFIARGERSPARATAFGRTRLQAPEVDGLVYVRGPVRHLRLGSRVQVRVTEALDYDSVGQVVS